MDIHKGTGYPCSKCHKSLASRKMLGQHEKACKEGLWHVCEECGKSYASAQILKQHAKAIHGGGWPEEDEVFQCSHCQKEYRVKKSMWEHAGVCPQNLDRKGPYYCRVEGCPKARHPFQHIKSLNTHMSGAHGWKE